MLLLGIIIVLQCLSSSSFSYFHNLQQRIQININTINLYKIISRIQKNQIELFIEEDHFINSIANILSIKIDNIIIELSLLENEKEESPTIYENVIFYKMFLFLIFF